MEERDEHPVETIAASALGALDPAEEAALARHLRGCAACGALLAQYRAVGALLPYALRPSVPAPAVRSALQMRLHGRDRGPWRRLRGWLRRLPRPALTARRGAIALLLSGLLLWNVWLQCSGPDRVAEVDRLARQPHGRSGLLVGAGRTAQANGRFYVDEEDVGGALAVAGLPPLPADRIYQLWFIEPDGGRVSGGTFRVDGHGSAAVIVMIPGRLTQYLGIGITEEPAEGSSSPSGIDVLIGTL